MEFESTEAYLKYLEDEELINHDGSPRKCFNCGCTEFYETNKYYEEHYLVEFQVKCLECGVKVGHWGYGNWGIC